jgi:hypothetical protein
MAITPEDIKQALEKSGYLFEQKVASLIEKLGYLTSTNKAYLDTEENKSREMDVLGTKKIFEFAAKKRIPGFCFLNCECKNSTTPFVFLSRPKGDLDKKWKPDGIYLLHDAYFQEAGRFNIARTLNAFFHLQLHTEHFATRESEKFVQVCKLIHNNKKLEAQHAGVIEGLIYPLIKSVQTWARQTEPKSYNPTCRFFFNLAVVNSKLYTMNSELPDALPVEVNFVPFIREIQTKEIKGSFLFTFITFDHLETFIQNEIEPFCNIVYRRYSESPELLEHVLLPS